MRKITLLKILLIFTAFGYAQTTCPASIKSNSTIDAPTFVLANGQNGCNEVTWPLTILVDGLTYSYVSCSGGNLKYIIDGGQTPPASFDVTVDYGNGLICDYDVDGNLITLSNQEFYNNKVALNVHPNPITKGKLLNIDFIEDTTGVIELYNITGQKIYSKSIKSSKNEAVSINKFNSGIYLMKIRSKGQTQIKKIIIQ